MVFENLVTVMMMMVYPVLHCPGHDGGYVYSPN